MKKIILISLMILTVLSLLLAGCQQTGQAGGLPQPGRSTRPQVFISPEKLSAKYGPSITTISGDKICTDFGYRNCVAAILRHQVSYFESRSNSCTGLQLSETEHQIVNCKALGTPYGCVLSSIPGAIVEPTDGDQAYFLYTEAVICQ